ncbi:hypothetical protein QLL95_gp0878 [Cotonvirus japonicus]|uniref:Uncharacterized protein n=1 Tax=Cotonvirus japonicus TaxID=2811091 RepID=A0ABM7NSU7_9VIRU|nr:hypothetical protein QLL95_gp0878 [Cotonvirus japonicus]BCS83245.1 hypothetical protein [Cotonvirus japonicus]
MDDQYIEHTDVLNKNNLNKIIDLRKQKISNFIITKLTKILNDEYKYNKFMRLCNYNNYHEHIFTTIKKFLFPKDIFFMIKVRGTFNMRVYVKFYHPVKYIERVSKKLNRQLKNAVIHNSKHITVKKKIDKTNLISAECYVRNYNKIFNDHEYVFKHEIYSWYSSGKYPRYISKYHIFMEL